MQTFLNDILCYSVLTTHGLLLLQFPMRVGPHILV